MYYNKLPVILKRYSFDEKMRILQYYSRRIMGTYDVELGPNQPILLFNKENVERTMISIDDKIKTYELFIVRKLFLLWNLNYTHMRNEYSQD